MASSPVFRPSSNGLLISPIASKLEFFAIAMNIRGALDGVPKITEPDQ
jgi:hypothetical protein